MKRIIFIGTLLSVLTLNSQQKGMVIEEEVIGHIYKPIKEKPTSAFLEELDLPKGFEITMYAKNLGKPRMMAKNNKGEVYVTRREGDIIRLTDSDNDGIADRRATVLTKKGVHGIDIVNDSIYLITVNEVYSGKIQEDGGIGDLTEIISDLPDGGQHAHSAPLDFIFYRGDMFPKEYRNKALVTFRGSWNRRPPTGYKLISIDFNANAPIKSEDVITGFLNDDGKSQYGRLVGLLELNDGSVVMSDDENGIIYRISYTGEKNASR